MVHDAVLMTHILLLGAVALVVISPVTVSTGLVHIRQAHALLTANSSSQPLHAAILAVLYELGS